MPARPNTLISRQKAILSKRQKPAGLRRRGQDGRNLIRRIQPTPPSLQKRSVALRLEREERGTQWKDCFPCRENFSMFISDMGLPDESGRGGGRLTQTAKHAGEAEPQEPHKQNVSVRFGNSSRRRTFCPSARRNVYTHAFRLSDLKAREAIKQNGNIFRGVDTDKRC